jgi:N-acetylglucosamine-6-phosphate deacetylase
MFRYLALLNLTHAAATSFPGVDPLLDIMREECLAIFATHTRADVRATQEAIEKGMRHATHFCDVFPAPEERDLGVRPCGAVEAILADERVTVDFILDGEHVAPVAVQMALKAKGPLGVRLITDSNMGAGLSPGRYLFGKEEIEFAYEGGPARMTEKASHPGSLAGSGLAMD